MSSKIGVLTLTIILSSMFLISQLPEALAVLSRIDNFRDVQLGNNNVYMDGVRVYGIPTICAFEIDHEFNEKLIYHANKAVREWERKIVALTGDSENWKFNFRTVSEAEQHSSLYMDCDMRIHFVKSIPPNFAEMEDNTVGIASPNLTYTDIWILYLERQYDRKTISEDEDSISYNLIPTGKFTNYLAKDILATIEHEIGHGLGLDHIQSRFFKVRENNAYAPSIMSHPSSIAYEQQIFQITTFDVNNVIKLYGQNGFNSYQTAEEYLKKNSKGCEGDLQILNKGFPDESTICCPEGYEIDGELCIEKGSSNVSNDLVGMEKLTSEKPDKIILAPFVDPTQEPLHYIIRYYSEPTYKDWFDTNYPNMSIEEAVGYDKNNPDVLVNIGVELFDIEEYHIANSLFDKALQIDRDNFNAISNKAASLINLGECDDSQIYLDWALRINPTDPVLLSNKIIADDCAKNNFRVFGDEETTLRENNNSNDIISRIQGFFGGLFS